ncbi:protein ZINC INDUCED FACILITATOR-LIKE 1-like isoform X2 [Tasmannia lanceolata]|uniref:protein ZINC INDUCED FACILITATOR-LIKE 1-like isoform X2 n=1 Tax=Tasmannia lanceolata TaxID=3420 RepID=UPI004064A0F2
MIRLKISPVDLTRSCRAQNHNPNGDGFEPSCLSFSASVSHPKVRDFHVAKRVEDIGFYAGFVGCSFMIGRALTSVFWGVIADRYGRKPVIMIGTISVVLFNTLFGLSTSFWMALSTRFLLGSCNGLLGPIKAYASEVTRPEYQALGLSVVSTSWGIGLIIGPALGGFLAQPAVKYPSIFSENSLFGRFPYFLPCLCISLVAFGVAIAIFWLPETLHMHNGKSKENCSISDDEEATAYGSDLKENIEEGGGKGAVPKRNLFTNWPLMSSIIVYCVFSLHDMAYTELFSLWAVSDRKYGGLSFSSNDVGVVLAISGFGLLVFQMSLYSTAEKFLGPIMVMRIAAVLSVPLLASYPAIAMLSGLSLALVINCASLLKNVLSMAIITGLFLLQNNAVPQHQRGAANGISMTAMSIFKAIGPGGGGALFSLAQVRQVASFLPGDQMIFFILNVVEVIGLILTFKPFLVLPDK